MKEATKPLLIAFILLVILLTIAIWYNYKTDIPKGDVECNWGFIDKPNTGHYRLFNNLEEAEEFCTFLINLSWCNCYYQSIK